MQKEAVLEYFGRRPGPGSPHVKVAEALGCTPENVLMWEDRQPIPEAPAFKIHVLTQGELKADPELYARIKLKRMRRRKIKAGNKK